MTIDLDAIKARLEGVTEGPWEIGKWGNRDQSKDWDHYVDGPEMGYDSDFRFFVDARFIAAARTDIPALVAEVEKMREALEAAEESIATFIGVHNYPLDSGAGDVLRQVSAALKGTDDDEN
jgi:hypothetical protein